MVLWCYVERAFADSEPVCLACEAGSGNVDDLQNPFMVATQCWCGSHWHFHHS